MDWSRASEREKLRQIPPWERDNIRDDHARPKKKRKKPRQKYVPLKGVDFSTYRRPEVPPPSA